MAADKKTYLRNAQKQVQKGQIDRAIASFRADNVREFLLGKRA